MLVEYAKKILSGNLSVISIEILQEAAKIILSELDKAEEEISELKKNLVEDLPGEIWKDIEGYEGLYQVSNKGRVKSFCFKSARIVGCSNSENYIRITLKGKHFPVHVLVARTFILNPENKPYVNHIDGNKSNNCVENLEWVTEKENTQHAVREGLIKSGSQSHNAKLTDEQVKFIRKNYKSHDKKFSEEMLAKKFNVNKNTIYKILHYITYRNVK